MHPRNKKQYFLIHKLTFSFKPNLIKLELFPILQLIFCISFTFVTITFIS